MRSTSFLIIFLVLIFGAIGFVVWLGAKNSRTDPGLVAFAACLSEKGAVMYGTESCSWCQKEKDGFKNAWHLINYVDCINDPKQCLALGIESTPTWIFPEGKKFVGYQGLKKLSEESGCPLPK
jgi:hypothetical protein